MCCEHSAHITWSCEYNNIHIFFDVLHKFDLSLLVFWSSSFAINMCSSDIFDVKCIFSHFPHSPSLQTVHNFLAILLCFSYPHGAHKIGVKVAIIYPVKETRYN